MTTNIAQKILEEQYALRRQLEPFLNAQKAFEESSRFRQIAENFVLHQEAIRTAFGPYEELRRAGLLDPISRIGGEFHRLNEMMAETQARFRLPEFSESAKLLEQMENSGLATAIKRSQEQASEIQRAMEAMRVPWLNIEDNLRSVGGFVELQGIGHVLRTMPAFDARLADALRIDLGDWREKLVWPSEIFTDSLARSSFYVAQGLDPSLTAFPSAAFEQSISITGLRYPSPPMVKGYVVEPEDKALDAEEAGLERTNAAHDRLQRFESQMRKFIDEKMKAAFGDNWIKQRVPACILQAWTEKRQKAKDSGEREWPLIAYADFGDYVQIITRRDNWKDVFEPVFGRVAFVQESFQRLFPIRICTMHARPITQDDELYLYVETRRLLAAIGIKV
jgi:hypothetical protein